MVGITSVISVEEVGRPLPGDACVITDAIGGYGSIAGQVRAKVTKYSIKNLCGLFLILEKFNLITDIKKCLRFFYQ